MKHFLIAHRYAKALSMSIEDDADLEPVLEWLRGFGLALEENADLRTALANPAIPAGQRAKALDALLEKSDVDPVVHEFLRVLLRRGRIRLVSDIAEVFSGFVDERLNRVTAEVTSAGDLDPAELERIREGLGRYSSKHVRMITDVDPSIIGGVVARIGGQVIDGSLRARVQQLRTALLARENETV